MSIMIFWTGAGYAGLLVCPLKESVPHITEFNDGHVRQISDHSFNRRVSATGYLFFLWKI